MWFRVCILTFILSFLKLVPGIDAELLVNNKPFSHIPVYNSLYQVNSTNGKPCIMVSVDAILSVRLKNIDTGEKEDSDIFLPDKPILSGHCSSNDNTQSLIIKFSNFILTMIFQKTVDEKNWYINSVNVSYSTSNKIFSHITKENLNVTLTSGLMDLFETPIGELFKSDEEKIIRLYPADKNDKSDHIAKLYLRHLTMQSFITDNNNNNNN